jgi:hypothetical protein
MRDRVWAAVCGLVIVSGVGCLDSMEEDDGPIEAVERAAPSPCPEPVDDQQAVSDAFLSVLYPDSGVDGPIACRWASPDCSARTTHLTNVPTGAPPSVAACRNAQASLMSCYNAAVLITWNGLDQGSAALLFEGAVRTRDAVVRAGSDDSSPAWLRSFGPANLLAKLFRDAGVPVNAALPTCASGTANQRYQCLAGVDRGLYRGLLALLDHHAGVAARNGRLIGASERAWRIAESATAPVHARIAQTRKIDPAGPRLNRIDLLGKYAVLRLLDGSADESGESHLAHLVSRATYVPDAAGPAARLYVPRFDIILAAARSLAWDEAGRKPVDRDPLGAGDLRALWRTVGHGISLAGLQGRCDWSQELQEVRFALAALYQPRKWQRMDRPLDLEELTAFDSSWFDYLSGTAVAEGRACGWITSEDYVYGWSSTSYWYEYDTWEDCEEGSTTNDGAVVTDCQTCDPDEVVNGVECDCHLETYCTRRGLFGGCTQEYSFWDCQFIVELQYSETTEETGRVADAYTFVTSIFQAYRDLMSYYDAFEKTADGYVKRGGGRADGIYDLHYDPLAEDNATIALSYVDGEQCDEELSTFESAFGNTPALDCKAGDLCDDDHGALWPSGAWIPFPIATRLCPETAGTFGGVLADDYSFGWCATPWDYTEAVARSWLPASETVIAAIAEEDALDWFLSDETWQAEDGESLEGILVHFFGEVTLHAQPSAAQYLRKAQVAYSAGFLPGLDVSTPLASETLGLDAVEALVDAGLEVMGKDFDLSLEFYELEDDVTGDTTPLMLLHDRPIPRLALAAMAAVSNATVDNDYTSQRAMIYPRLGDALELYRELVRLKLEVLWRRADGFGQCIATGTCKATAGPGCADYCGYYEDALSFTAEASAELDAVDEMLSTHALWIDLETCPFAARRAVSPFDCGAEDPADLHGYIGRLRDHIAGTRDELARAAVSIQAGNDAFGFRGVNHYPGNDVDSRIEALLDGVIGLGRTYEGFIDDYLATLASYSEFESSVASAAITSSQLLAGYCADEFGVAQPEGCAVDKTTWSTDHELVGAVNQALAETVCAGTVVDRETGAQLNVTPAYLDDNGYTELYGLFQEYMTSLGLSPSFCPELTGPDFPDGFGGSLAGDLISMELILEQLAGHLARYRTELYAQETMSDLIQVIQSGVDGETDEIARAETIGSAFACIAAVAAAVATEGAATPGAVAACANFVVTAETGTDADSLEALQLDLQTALAGYSSLQNLMAIVFDVYTGLLQYDAAVASFDAHRAQFLNLQVNIEADYRNLYDNAFRFDPTNLLFADEHVASMAFNFQSAMRNVRELEILVGYDLGRPILEDRAVYIENDYYYLPRLADITVAEHYDLANDSAYVTLRGSAKPTDERKLTLVSFAALLGAIREAAETLSGGEQTTHGFLSEADGSGFDAAGNPESYTEWTLLRRSPFYNAWITSDPTGDDALDGGRAEPCAEGQVDLYYYCKNPDGTPMGPENNCLTVSSLDEATRINLAWADQLVVGIDAIPFTCTESGGVYSIAPATGANGVYLSMAELNPGETRDGVNDFDWYLPDFMETGTVTGVGDDRWYSGGPVSQEFYDSQTPTVRRLMDDVFDMADYGVVSVDVKTFMPGSYLLALHPSDAENPNTVFDPVINDFDLEGWGLVGATGADETFAERLEDISILCADSTTCEGQNRDGSDSVESHYARVFYSGPGHQSTMCTGDAHQEKSEWLVDDRSVQGAFAIRSTVSDEHEADAAWMSARIDNGAASVKAGVLDGLPLQPTLAVFQVFGLTDSDGVEEPNKWVLHVDGADETPNLRIAFRYRYYGAELSTNAEWDESEAQSFFESALPCVQPTSAFPW